MEHVLCKRTPLCRSCTAVVFFAAFLLSVSMLQAQAAPSWPPQANQFRFHMIGNAHIDPVWLWPWSEGISVVHSTFRSALERMSDDPDIAMTTSSSQFYEWVAENDPTLLAEIRRRVDEGRWDLVGGWWVEPDVNIPNGESLARQGLYGQQSLKKLFGRTAKVGYNPDSFGHPGSLPQILKLQGMKNYVFMRPGVNEKEIPGNLFWWQGIDGTRSLTYRIPLSYNDGNISIEPQMRNTVEELSLGPLRDAMEYFGIGDHGGGPTKANLASIRMIQSEPGAPKVLYSTPDRYFAEIRRSLHIDIPELKGDLQHHSVGCYTAESSVKKGNREAEAALVTAEELSAIGSFAWGAHYPRDEFTSSWKRVLFLQFHDSMAGTALPEQYATARQAYGRAIDVAQQSMYISAQKLAWKVPALDPDSNYLFVFNPHAWSTTQNIEYDLGLPDKTSYTVEDSEGHPVPFQWVQATTAAQGRRRIVAQVSLPAFGYQQIRIRKSAVAVSESTSPPYLKAEKDLVENARLRVTFSPEGTVGIFDKATGREVFRGGQTGARALVLSDLNDTWAHNLVAYTQVVGSFKADSIKLVETGPLRARMRVNSVYGNSSLTIDWILYAGGRELEASVALDWHEHMKMLKFSFPVDVEVPTATYEIPYGAIERATRGDEDPGQRWIDVSGAEPYGLAVINDAKYGYSVDRSDLRVSVARGAVYANHLPQKIDPNIDYQWQDQGIQTFRMVLVPHSGFWQDAGVVHQAEELVAPPLVVYQGIHSGTWPQSNSFLSVDASDVVISAIKLAEVGDALIVRLYEAEGRVATATLDLHFANVRWAGKFHPFEIKTLRIDPNSGVVSEVNILEQ